jgi:SPP1 family predicted phage head-tail adaptor
MEAGKLRLRATFQQGVDAGNGEGFTTWTDLVTVWVQDRQLVGQKMYQALQVNSKIKGEIIARYNSLIDNPSLRIKIGTRILRIISVINIDARSIELVFPYEELLD